MSTFPPPLTVLKSLLIVWYAAAAKLLQSCPTPCDPIDGSPPGSSAHGIFQARVLEWDAIAFPHSVVYNMTKIYILKFFLIWL